MLHHVVVFRFVADITDEQRRAVVDGLCALPETIDVIRTFAVGTDVGAADGNDDLAVTATFDDVDSWRTYAEHPQHQRFIAEVMRPVLADRHAVQFST